ncbi:TPA: ATP phosphoribosyltransferase [Legionella pneumophila subsp. pneumophila]|uniref:ATP phosphoribosyltransferase n=2 Tax=Legionella pneumophila TaxID=446 RepID=UPI0001E3CB3B|nr:ATP phosphoribosyltransferase [Legionella pneumophila]AMV13981.1 ATP phosphoribosyltransferase [Legionella pneumophila]ANN92244.1 ATP phosphoribosyltransferase [Legionella pneumophila]MCZ4679210.1 ATP phosphoribosyltransferase [Legionella pneumophila]MCZ4704872.1 ATP phosphoribosyltransferase [Legionella pneumophila]MCZ4750710.1 ATP phosphoribosyltransferase [Legionella pneumophila]
MKNRLRLALQKKGRLSDESLNLLQRCGLKFRIKPNALLTHVDNFPIDLLFVRDDDIPTLVFDSLCDGGIVGENVLLEASFNRPDKAYRKILALGSCNCRLSIAIPEAFDYQGAGSLDGKRIATSYPNLLNNYLAERKISAEILTLSGSVEVAPRMGMADVICDLVSTGQTLEDNKLKEVDTVLNSQAVFIQTQRQLDPDIQDLFAMLARRIQAVQQAQERKYIVFHAPKSALERIAQKLPGAESPTILPLPGNNEKVAVHVVSSEGVFWNTLETIQYLGASSILVLPIEKMLE